MLLNTLFYKLSDTPLSGVGYNFVVSVMSFAGSHILLNIRRLGLPRDQSDVTSLPTVAFTSAPHPTAATASTSQSPSEPYTISSTVEIQETTGTLVHENSQDTGKVP
ncbi:hypothetical protein PHLCEN_2v5955 [Hermanssonia centrifuga]|uniref:Uncharacterized protein n=1 Tax=Hermanssonia centrifuga TaxID=98765 RepID=A0A2R6P0Y3_9APHY|nr:hypothetical protein PHLCEN_2v5955 [Hermanssonia centrifuga]